MKRILALILMLCMLLGALPTQALAYAGDIFPASGTVKTVTLSSGSLALQNDYLRVIVRKDGTLSTAPAADSTDPIDRQTPLCEFVTYGTNHIAHPASLRPKSVKFVNTAPGGAEKAIKVEYDLTVDLSLLKVTGSAAVYYELVQLGESGAGTWGVLTSVEGVKLNEQDSQDFFQTLNTDVGVFWGYTLDGFTAMGHAKATDGPVIKMNRTVYDSDTKSVLSTENSMITGSLEDISTWASFSQGGNWCYDYITEVYVDGYNWANPFVGLSEYYKRGPIRAYLPDTVSVTPGNSPAATRVECWNDVGLYFAGDDVEQSPQRFLWGFRNLVAGEDQLPTAPDEVSTSISAKRLAAFADGNGGVTVEYVADDAALAALKKQYGNPVAIINGDYESTNGSSFEFTGGAALLSPSVTATWGTGGKLIIHRDGTVEQSGVSLNAPTFKFYQPNSGSGKDLEIKLTKDGFTFGIDPEKNDAIVFVDIPYATVKLEQAAADAAGNLVFTGEIGFQTIFNGLEFTMEKLGYGLVEKNVNGTKTYEFKVNGVKAKGSFDTAKLMALELAKVKGEVNTFKGEERYAFSLELNAFDLFETEAELALERSEKDGSLIPDELWFYVKADPGIPLIPPIPIGQLNGGGAGFKDLAATVNGNYFAIPPLKLRGALTGTYLHLIQGTGNVVLGPSEISLKATDVGLVGVGKAGQIIDSFGYSLQLNGQERNYGGTTYKGIYFAGSQELALNLPNKTIDAIQLNSSVKLGAFGGVAGNTVYLGVGANGTVTGRVQIPSDIPVAGGFGADVGNINLVIGGQTTLPIRNVSVSEAMKQAFKDVNIYLGAMVGVDLLIVDTRVWVLIPNIIKTNFRRGEGWGIVYRWLKKLPEWDWKDHGIDPLVQAMPQMEAAEEAVDGMELALHLADVQPLVTLPPTTFNASAGEGETPYILLAFDSSVTEQQIKDNLSVTKENSTNRLGIYWVNDAVNEDEKGHIDRNADINAATDIIKNKDDENSYRVAILRLKEGGSYEVNTGSLPLVTEKSKDFAVTPFEKLALTQSGNTLSGEVKYPTENTSYVLRTYLNSAEGEETYLVDEQVLSGTGSINVSIPTSGTLAPTGSYYVTSFLMTEKEFTLEDGTSQTELVAIDSQKFTELVSYRNANQPDAPQNVRLVFAGNEVMTASWDAAAGADGYTVTIYQLGDNGWVDTGFGYDLDKDTTTINMALTVGGEETSESKNLYANETYKVGVRAYKTIEGGKYYSTETESNDERLPEYSPLNISLAVNDRACEADDNGVYHAYVGDGSNVLTVNCITEGVTYKATQMDTDGEIGQNEGEATFTLPEFTGSLMFKIEGIKDKDVTSVFLLVSRDETAPVLTLSAPVFYANRNTGAYTITGTADAGSEILYGGDEPVYAAGDGSFTISGTLDERNNSSVLSLCAQDSAGNRSAFQLALVARQTETQSDPSDGTSGGSYAPGYPIETPEQTPNGTITVSPKNASKGSTVTITVQPDAGYELGDLTVSDGNGNQLTLTEKGGGKFTFTMPGSKVKITASFRPLSPAFYDVSPSAWYASAVNYVVSKGLMNGTGEGKFSPSADTTRGMIVTILARMDGQSTSGTPWYAAGQRWAMEHEISDGTKMTAAITREQLVTMLFRYAVKNGMNAVTLAENLSRFTDASDVSAWAVSAMQWAVGQGLIQGSNGKLRPQSNASRAEAAMILMRFCELLKK